MDALFDYSALRQVNTHKHLVAVDGYSAMGDGGEGLFFWDSDCMEYDNDGTIIKNTANAKGAWVRVIEDVVNISWFGAKNDGITNSALQFKNAVNAAIKQRTKVLLAPGTYLFDEIVNIDVPDKFTLIVEGNNAIIKATTKVTDNPTEVNLIRFFTSTGVDTLETGVFINNLNIDGPVKDAQFTEPDINKIKRIHSIVFEDIYTVSVTHCTFKNIQGSGIRAFNFVHANFNNLSFNNVGGKFHLENQFDSFGDGVYLCQTNLETTRPTRRQSNATITNCNIAAFNPLTNGNYASRCGICIEGFGSLKSDHKVTLAVSDGIISGFDRSFHIEGISAEITANNLNITSFQSIFLLASARSKSTFNNCRFTGRLADNPNQARLGNGGIMTYTADLPDKIVLNGCQISIKGAATFIGQFELNDTTLDYGNNDVVFENSTLTANKAKFLNVPHNLSKNLNFYGCAVNIVGSTIQGFKNGTDNSGGVFHFENLDLESFDNNTVIDTRLIFTFRPSNKQFAQITNNKVYRNPKGTGSKMDALINYNNIPQVKMSGNQFYITLDSPSDNEPIYLTYNVQNVSKNNDLKFVQIGKSGKAVRSKL